MPCKSQEAHDVQRLPESACERGAHARDALATASMVDEPDALATASMVEVQEAELKGACGALVRLFLSSSQISTNTVYLNEKSILGYSAGQI